MRNISIDLIFATAVTALCLMVGPGCEKARTPERADAPETVPAEAPRVARQADAVPSGAGADAMKRAAEADRYLFVFFYHGGDDPQTQAMRDVFENAAAKVSDRADRVAIDITDPQEGWIVRRFDVSRTPMPLVLSVAPNGAVVRGFPQKFDEPQLMEAFASPSMEQVLKVLQQRKLVLLCIQNSATRSNDEAMRGVQHFKLDQRFSGYTEVVMLDPADGEEAKALRNLDVDPGTDEAVTVLLTPPGRAIAKFKGATDKAMFVAALTPGSSGCGPAG